MTFGFDPADVIRYRVRWLADNTYLVRVKANGLFEWGPKERARLFTTSAIRELRTTWDADDVVWEFE